MKLRLIAALLAFALAACNTSVAPPQERGSAPNTDINIRGSFVEGQLVIGYREGADPQVVADKLGATVRTDWPQIKAALLVLPEGLPVEKAQATAAHLEGLRYAEPNYVRKIELPKVSGSNTTDLSPAQVEVNDPEFGRQWMHRQLNSLGAWEQGVSGAGIRIGIHDDFIDHRHPDLVDNVLYPGFDGFKASQPDTPIEDAFITADTPHDGVGFHGSSVAGTAAAVGNGIGGRGSAHGASIVPLAINEPEDGALVLSAIVNSAIFAVIGPDLRPGGDDRAPGTDPETGPYVHIVNMSWGGDFYSQIVKDTMDFMLASGIVLVTSAGNTPTEGPSFPSWLPGLINVAATTPTDERTTFSNRGMHLDVAAPGQYIWTTTTRSCVFATPDYSSCTPEDPEVAYTYISGTSFSSPATAGVAALIMEAAAERDAEGNITGLPSAAQVARILRETAFQPEGYDFSALGAGIVDSEAAVERALEGPVEDGGTLLVEAVLEGNPDVNVPAVGLVLIPEEEDETPVEYTQTSNGVLFPNLFGVGLFQQIPAGEYTLQASGPYKSVFGTEVDTAELEVEVNPGEVTAVQITLDPELFDDPFEPNGSVDEAAELEEAGVTVLASLYDPEGDTDVDVYALPVEAGEEYRVNFETVAGLYDAALTVYAADGSTVIAQNDNNQDFTTDPLVEFEAPEDGVVYLEVSEISELPAANNPFNLYELDIAPIVGDEEEPNGSAEVSGTTIQNVDVTDAQEISLGSALDAALGEGDTDIFQVSVPAGETLVADIETAVSGEPDTLLGVYDEDGVQVAFNDDYIGRESRVSYTSEEGGTYYLVIAPWDAINPNNATEGPYGLTVTSHLNPPTE